MVQDPACSRCESVSTTLSATGTSHLFCRHVRQSSATMTAVGRQLNNSTAACRTMWRRCCTCVNVILQIKAVCTCKLHFTVAHVGMRPGPARIQLASVKRTDIAGMQPFLSDMTVSYKNCEIAQQILFTPV